MNVLWRLVKFVRPYWWGSAVSVVLILVLTTFRLGPAWFTKLIIDQAIPQRDLGLAVLFIGALLGVSALTNALTPAGREMIDRPWETRRAVLASALRRASCEDRAAIARGLEALCRALEADASQSGGSGPAPTEVMSNE